MAIHVRHLKQAALLVAAWGMTAQAHALATEEELAQIGTKYTCTGAEKAGSAAGVAEYTGKYLGAMPGMVANAEKGEHPTDPYAAEKPLFVITAENFAKYAERLTPGQQAMFRKYPSFRMDVYPSHRDFRYDDAVCRAAQANARQAKVHVAPERPPGLAYSRDPTGLKLEDAVRGAVPFPFPKTGLELVWNVIMAPRAATALRESDVAVVYPNLKTIWGGHVMWSYAPAHDARLRGQPYEGVAEYMKVETVAPARDKGSKAIEHRYFDYSKAGLQWGYVPYIRRLRQAPDYSLMFDNPIPSTANTVGWDEFRLMNGSPERYEWTILGKREYYQPANNYRLEGQAVGAEKYRQLLTPGHENPDFVRWELRRAWVLEGKLKAGYRHLYPLRTLYIDEDSYRATMTEMIDAKGQLWRFSWANNLYVGGARSNTWETYSAYYHDLLAGTYTAYDLTQGKEKSLQLDAPDVEYAKPEFYSLERMLSDIPGVRPAPH